MLRIRFLSLAGLALLACAPSPRQIADGPDPLEALGSPALSSRYTVEFWAREVHGGSVLWRKARGFCEGRDPAAFPNCHAVAVAGFWESPPPFPRPRHTLEDLLPRPPAGPRVPPVLTPPAAPGSGRGGRP